MVSLRGLTDGGDLLQKESKLKKLEQQAERSDEEDTTEEKERMQRKKEMEQLKREIIGMKKGSRVKVCVLSFFVSRAHGHFGPSDYGCGEADEEGVARRMRILVQGR